MTTEQAANTGQRRLDRVIATFRETGIVTGECKVDGPGTGQAAWCYSHGFSGAIQACHHMRDGAEYSAYDCPYRGIATWIARRHEYARLEPDA